MNTVEILEIIVDDVELYKSLTRKIHVNRTYYTLLEINSLSFSIANSKSFALADFGFSPCVREGRGQVKLPIS